ncbi:MAG: hypothetical protein IIB57_07270, partial [Planctomycetes bacterium]|nr:hypothetical protein [Planctomycetota bacterium]
MNNIRSSRLAHSKVYQSVLPLVLLIVVGCASPPRMSVHAARYRLDLQLDPTTHHLVGRATIDLERTAEQSAPIDGRIAVEFLLHPHLKVLDVTAGGATVIRRFVRRNHPHDDPLVPHTHAVVLKQPVDALTLFVDFEGELNQDVSAGEKAGQIHNFDMKAHIGVEGIYLGGGNWYPRPLSDEDNDPQLTEFTLVIAPIEGMALVAGAERAPKLAARTERLAWKTPFPIEEMVVVGGPHEVHESTHHHVAVSLHLKPEQAKHAAGLFEAVKRNLDRYEPLIGAYPAGEFAIVDNFFSSGFAFPTFTLLSSAVIDMGERSQTAHGYIDHEMLHCWWGNGIHVDPRDGNWCEALASYGANYYGHVLDGNDKEARRKRRNYSHFLSRIEPEKDKPLGTYGQEDGCGRGIAYSKGAAVFHMLARKIGQDNFWAAMRRFTAEYTGRFASWRDIQRLCEEEGDISLDTFFQQWVRGGGAPTLRIEQAVYHSGNRLLTLSVHQGENSFDLNVPVRVTHADGTSDVEVELREASQDLTIPLDVVPLTVEIDPDYHLFRKIPLEEILPTTVATRYGSAFATVLPVTDLPGPYKALQDIFESSFEENERRTLVVGEIEEGALANSCLLILGDAVRDPHVSAFLSAVEFPVRWLDNGFVIGDEKYLEPTHAVVATASHPDVPGGGVTVFFANSEGAIPPGMLIPFYEH